jgi:hypothetical protein
VAAIIEATTSNWDAGVQSQSESGDATPPEVMEAQERVSVLSGDCTSQQASCAHSVTQQRG